MDGFSNLDETRSQTSVGFSTATFRQRLESTRQAWQIRSTLEKGLLIAVVALSILALGLTIGLAASGGKDNDNTPEPSPEVCLTPGCTMAASRILESLDRSVNPCSDFYAYACGTWRKTNVIPEDSTSIDALSTLGNKIQIINKDLYEDPNNVGANEEAWRKAKDVYDSCMNTDLLEQKNLSVITPILEALGGWPVLGGNPGGKWNERNFDLVALLVNLSQYGVQPIIRLGVGPDSKNSTQRIIHIGQASAEEEAYLTLASLFGASPSVAENDTIQTLKAYMTFAMSTASLFGADPTQADTDMRQVLKFYLTLQNISMSTGDQNNPHLTYNKMTLAEIRGNFTEPRRTDPIQFNWNDYVRGIMSLNGVNIQITDKEPIVVTSIPYLQRLFGLLQQYSKRTIANFIVWSFMQRSDMALALPSRFKELYDHYMKDSTGQMVPSARWSECETVVTKRMGHAISQKFVKQEFHDTKRKKVEEMVKNIRSAFNALLQDVEWMDDHTKSLAEEKAEAIRNRIGYPDDLLNNTFINRIYKNILVDKEEFLENILNCLKVKAVNALKTLREPYNTTSIIEVWSLISPTSVNAAYSRPLNDIFIPVGILHRPFYDENQPQSMNFGGIGTVIGHEITHGFDSTGREYDKYGNLKQWWDQKIIDNFNRQATCMVNQYGSYVVPEANMTVNGNLTLGENIADNGGLKQSYQAYRRWVHDQGKEEPKLPGLDLTNNQLFFVSFAQHWCMNSNRQTARSLLLQDTHSPDQFRVIGSLQNSDEFAAAFSCPRKSYMNPEKKCSVW